MFGKNKGRTANRRLLSVAGLWLVGQRRNNLNRQCFVETAVGIHRHRKATAKTLSPMLRKKTQDRQYTKNRNRRTP